MCTLTAFPLEEGILRLGFNRDESRSRPEGLGPAAAFSGKRRILRPIDPQGGGTWIGVNDAGMAAALMNVYTGAPAPARRPDQASRGGIVPALLSCESLEAARERAGALEAERYPPFRVFLCQAAERLEILSDGGEVRVEPIAPLERPLMRATSGLGDDRVDAPRRGLFESLLASGDSRGIQDAFHRHSWPERPGVSVCMRRAEAATVSFTLIEIEPRRRMATVTYHPGPPDEPAARNVASLELHA